MLSDDKTFRVGKESLLIRLRTNRELHAKQAAEAQAAWREKAMAALKERLALAREHKRFSLSFPDLSPPPDHTSDYDQVIGLLEMCLDESIEITPSEHRRYVLDDWEWKRAFRRAFAAYTAKDLEVHGESDWEP